MIAINFYNKPCIRGIAIVSQLRDSYLTLLVNFFILKIELLFSQLPWCYHKTQINFKELFGRINKIYLQSHFVGTTVIIVSFVAYHMSN